MTGKDKVLMIGLDGATPNLLFHLAEKGILPTFNHIMTGGSYGRLRSTVPPVTSPAWVSSATGVDIGKHGIHDFFLSVDLRKREFVFADSTQRRVDAVWNILSAAGKKVVVLNFPVTYPPEKVNGALVSGMLTPSLKSDFTYPKGLKDDLLNLGYEIDIADTMLDELLTFKSDKISMLSRIREVARKRVTAAEYLMKQFEWDLFIVVFVAFDRIQHLYWKYLDPTHIAYNARDAKAIYPHILDCYKEIDQSINRLLKHAGENTNVVIYSDHGFKPLNRTFFTNNLLREQGLLKLKRKVFTNILPTQETFLKKMSKLHVERLIGKFPSPMKRKTSSFLSPSREFLDIFAIEPNETKAFQFGYGSIEIDRNIVQSDKEYEEIRTNITTVFNKKLFDVASIRAYRKEELYHGPALNNLPDITLVSEKDVTPRQLIPTSNMLMVNYDETIDVPALMWNGDHALFGVILMAGPKVRKCGLIRDVSIIDITPTVLYLMNEQAPPYMDGKALKEVVVARPYSVR